MKKSIIVFALAVLGLVGILRAAQPAAQAPAACCEGSACCYDGSPCCQ